MVTDLSARTSSSGRMFAVLAEEITRLAPRAIWDWPELGPLVDPADRALQRTANRYEEGHATRDEVVAAAEEVRAAWKQATRRFAPEPMTGAMAAGAHDRSLPR